MAINQILEHIVYVHEHSFIFFTCHSSFSPPESPLHDVHSIMHAMWTA